jgi:hypothetical protein
MQTLLSFIIIVSLSLFSQLAIAQVERSQLTTNVESREPTDNLNNRVQGTMGEVKRVYFFTQISGLSNQQITHRWLHQGDEKAAVTLNIGSDSWRTYSSKRIPSYWQGEWQVQVWQGDLMLVSHDFVVNYSE